MKRIFAGILALSAILLTVFAVSNAAASPTNVLLTVSPSTTVNAGESFTFDLTGNCDTATCRNQILIFGPGFARNGTVLVEGTHLVTKLSVGVWTILGKITNSNGTNGFGQSQVTVEVKALPAPPVTTTVVVPPPVVVTTPVVIPTASIPVITTPIVPTTTAQIPPTVVAPTTPVVVSSVCTHQCGKNK